MLKTKGGDPASPEVVLMASLERVLGFAGRDDPLLGPLRARLNEACAREGVDASTCRHADAMEVAWGNRSAALLGCVAEALQMAGVPGSPYEAFTPAEAVRRVLFSDEGLATLDALDGVHEPNV